VNAQYEKKPDLKPIYDLLLKKITALGKDIEIAPKKTSVSLRVKRQFALIQPSTKTRIDLGLKFNDKAHEGRLETSGPFGSMCTHRVQITDTKQVNKELIGWIKEAYNEAK
jgi:predicted transport protein